MWKDDNEWEENWWGNCINTLGEELKQLKYAELMGLKFFNNDHSPYNIDLKEKHIIDWGGGPASLLLKCVNGGSLAVVDPGKYPNWVRNRYREANILDYRYKAEVYNPFYPNSFIYDEAWVYNVLQHVEDVEKVVANILASAKIVRVFEWLNTGVTKGHPNNLTEELLNRLFKGEGKVTMLNAKPCVGQAYSGVFKGNSYGV